MLMLQNQELKVTILEEVDSLLEAEEEVPSEEAEVAGGFR